MNIKILKKIGCLGLALAFAAGGVACGKREQTEKPSAEAVSDLTEFSLPEYLQPVWEGNHVYAETAMLLKNEQGSIDDISLYYPVKEIVAVRNVALDVLYTEGVDYEVTSFGDLRILESGALYDKACEYGVYYQDEFVSGQNWAVIGGGGQLKTEAENGQQGLTQYQIAVTYTHDSSFAGEVPAYKGDLIPNTVYKLERKEKINVVCLGDSISAGWTASGYEWVNLKPFMPVYFDLVTGYLKEYYQNSAIVQTNLSVGGMTSAWGKEDTQIYNATQKNPDLMIVAFGMNDGADPAFSVEMFKNNIREIIEKVRAKCPDTEFILVSTMLPNKELGYNEYVSILQHQKDYLPALSELEKELDGVAVADVTTVHEELLNRKDFRDMSSNNINHPNDFMQRVYAQVILKSMIIDF